MSCLAHFMDDVRAVKYVCVCAPARTDLISAPAKARTNKKKNHANTECSDFCVCVCKGCEPARNAKGQGKGKERRNCCRLLRGWTLRTASISLFVPSSCIAAHLCVPVRAWCSALLCCPAALLAQSTFSATSAVFGAISNTSFPRVSTGTPTATRRQMPMPSSHRCRGGCFPRFFTIVSCMLSLLNPLCFLLLLRLSALLASSAGVGRCAPSPSWPVRWASGSLCSAFILFTSDSPHAAYLLRRFLALARTPVECLLHPSPVSFPGRFSFRFDTMLDARV